VLRVSRQALYTRPKIPRDRDGNVVELREMPPLPDDWETMTLSPAVIDWETALHVLARRHPAAGYRKLCSRLRRAGWPLNRKRIARNRGIVKIPIDIEGFVLDGDGKLII